MEKPTHHESWKIDYILLANNWKISFCSFNKQHNQYVRRKKLYWKLHIWEEGNFMKELKILCNQKKLSEEMWWTNWITNDNNHPYTYNISLSSQLSVLFVQCHNLYYFFLLSDDYNHCNAYLMVNISFLLFSSLLRQADDDYCCWVERVFVDSNVRVNEWRRPWFVTFR